MDVLMPQLGETVAEGKITRWFKGLGEAVARGDNLCEIETDKVTVEVPSISDGVLTAINADVGTVAPVGMVIAVVSDPSAASAASMATLPAKAIASPPAPARILTAPVSGASPTSTISAASRASAKKQLDPFREVDTPRGNFGPAKLASGILTTPLARRLANGASLDIGKVTGSGPRGRITARDVEKAVALHAPSASEMGRAFAEAPIPDLYRRRPHKLIAVDGMRRTIAARLTQSKATVPHFYLTAHIDVGRLAKVRAEINDSAPKGADDKPAYKLSLNDFMVKALALALRDVPAANAIWSVDGILEFDHSDVAVAVAVPGGLFTPVIADADTKSIAAISAEIKDLARRAMDRALRPEEYQGGSTTISNLGMHGVKEFSAIINPPQATILAIGAAHRHPVEVADSIAFIDRITATLSCDHRVIDGVLGAELLGAFKSLVESPLRMLV